MSTDTNPSTPPAEASPLTGEALYTAYRAQAGERNHRGEPLPLWADLTEDRQHVWQGTAAGLPGGPVAAAAPIPA